MLTSIQIHNLAVQFRTLDHNLGHVSVYEAMTELGMGFNLGVFVSIPKGHWRKRRTMAMAIADQLDRKANAIEGMVKHLQSA